MTKEYYVYIMASRRNGTLYAGVTSDLVRRAWEHKNHVCAGFTSKYNVCLLVWYEVHQDVNAAIHRETCIKAWRRKWKLDLIEALNRDWIDLYNALVGQHPDSGFLLPRE
jgi:putative endonuclease